MNFQKSLPYSGIELNHHLNPLPRFEHDQTFSTQKKFLDKEVVKIFHKKIRKFYKIFSIF